MKKLIFSALISTLLLGVAGCGNSPAPAKPDQSSAPNQSAAAPQNLLEKVKAEGKLVIGTEGTYSPFTFHDQSGKLTGYDVDVVTEVAKRLGVEPVFQETQWDAMFAGLDAKRFDLIANEVGVRPDRQEKYDFSTPYSISRAVLVAHKDNETVKDFPDIKGRKAGQSMTSNYADMARDLGADIVAVDNFNNAMELIATKRVEVVLNDNLTVLDFLKQRPDTPIKIVKVREEGLPCAFMFRKGSEELIQEINKVLDGMHQDGTLKQISEKWFGEDISK
ncbi:transporter substrate-binding domain-containing protein [Brevibacillus ruminantium]|uniref:Transporter substrate-binding domain-containing protein n=1 Tax=Brevibacillus ruminantium TaxID=2950604 RepID=A0ABY4WIZ2_9BACL|nr:transporter substrate-binding domain-containing protein [Brevibacillus ruminantium]USG67077.1 transporter substrate-binding domain-containing protein [Brevibacillus ruminantium]